MIFLCSPKIFLLQRCPTLWNSTLKNYSVVYVNLTLFSVENSNIDIHNIVSSLSWRFQTLYQSISYIINLRTMLKQQGNVYRVNLILEMPLIKKQYMPTLYRKFTKRFWSFSVWECFEWFPDSLNSGYLDYPEYLKYPRYFKIYLQSSQNCYKYTKINDAEHGRSTKSPNSIFLSVTNKKAATWAFAPR